MKNRESGDVRAAARGPGELQALLDAAVDAVVLIDNLGRIQSFNRSSERLFGYRAQEVLGRSVNLLMTDADRDAHDGHLNRYLSSRVPHIIGKRREVSARRKDGTVFSAFLAVGALADTEAPRFVGFFHDRTQEREAGEQARRLRELLWDASRLATVSETATGIAHELNQPLAAIANYAQACDRLLSQPNADLDEVRAALREIAGQSVRAGDIIRRLRGLLRPHRSQCQATDINVLITELTELVKSEADAHHVRFRAELGRELPKIEVDVIQIQQLILNLVRNAIDALQDRPAGGRELLVRTSRAQDGDVEVLVSDNGTGVPATLVPRLFEPFTTSKPYASGLGLAIGRTIALEHNGTLSHRPNSPSGSCFVLRLPSPRE